MISIELNPCCSFSSARRPITPIKLHVGEDPMLQAVESGDLSDEAIIRMLKAKVNLLQEEAKMNADALAERDSQLQEALEKCADLDQVC